MKNKLRLQYYKLIIKYYSLFEKDDILKLDGGIRWYYHHIKVNPKRDKIVKYVTLYNELYNSMYPEKIQVDCLESCGIPEFEKAVQEPVLFIK